jgi:2-hydroxychromene-2-carboxylate isomerase
MKHITFYLDFISPYAYMAFEKLPQTLAGISHEVTYKPMLFAGLLQHYGQLGPAEIAPKRAWTYRQVDWLAQHHGIPLNLPAAHPFNPIGLLRLAVACDAAGTPNRHVVETIFHHVWRSGAPADDPARLQQLLETLAPARAPDAPEVKAQLKAHGDEAIARGLFGVPTFAVDDKLFWGFDALPMLRDYLDATPWFSGSRWDEAAAVPQGKTRTSKPAA